MVTRFSFLLALLMAFYSSQAVASQYAYYAPYPYYAERAWYPAYARAPYPYYPAYRYPHRSENRPAQRSYQAPAATSSASSTPVPAPVAEQLPAVDSNNGINTGLAAKKQAFIATLLPIIDEENRRLSALRAQLLSLFGKLETQGDLNTSEQQQLRKLASRYRVARDPLDDQQARAELLRRIDIIPSSLALAQAVNESAWGESRFALEANNLFGIWTYDQDKGIKPLRREEGKMHLVRIFDDYGDSVRYYMHTLNSHPAYDELRRIRQQLRDTNQVIDGHQLAAGLEKYSAKGRAYIELIQDLIERNRWAVLDSSNQRV
ncbi:MAG: glucosaminidase domain-containing protein [Thiotrichales bacterium]|nr:MAG: glucosaminidase domain-containing protein [Thiotrichales bacterium]